MNEAILSIIEEIDGSFKCIKISFINDEWRKDIPSEPGWYLIKTNTPVDILKELKPPQSKSHISILATIKQTSQLGELGITINQLANGGLYVVYSGEAKNLKSRAREHARGHEKTYCLCLNNYKEILRKYDWFFCYVPISICKSLSGIDKDDKLFKLLRLAVEQGWRTKHGWPILCRK